MDALTTFILSAAQRKPSAITNKESVPASYAVLQQSPKDVKARKRACDKEKTPVLPFLKSLNNIHEGGAGNDDISHISGASSASTVSTASTASKRSKMPSYEVPTYAPGTQEACLLEALSKTVSCVLKEKDITRQHVVAVPHPDLSQECLQQESCHFLHAEGPTHVDTNTPSQYIGLAHYFPISVKGGTTTVRVLHAEGDSPQKTKTPKKGIVKTIDITDSSTIEGRVRTLLNEHYREGQELDIETAIILKMAPAILEVTMKTVFGSTNPSNITGTLRGHYRRIVKDNLELEKGALLDMLSQKFNDPAIGTSGEEKLLPVLLLNVLLQNIEEGTEDTNIPILYIIDEWTKSATIPKDLINNIVTDTFLASLGSETSKINKLKQALWYLHISSLPTTTLRGRLHPRAAAEMHREDMIKCVFLKKVSEGELKLPLDAIFSYADRYKNEKCVQFLEFKDRAEKTISARLTEIKEKLEADRRLLLSPAEAAAAQTALEQKAAAALAQERAEKTAQLEAVQKQLIEAKSQFILLSAAQTPNGGASDGASSDEAHEPATVSHKSPEKLAKRKAKKKRYKANHKATEESHAAELVALKKKVEELEEEQAVLQTGSRTELEQAAAAALEQQLAEKTAATAALEQQLAAAALEEKQRTAALQQQLAAAALEQQRTEVLQQQLEAALKQQQLAAAKTLEAEKRAAALTTTRYILEQFTNAIDRGFPVDQEASRRVESTTDDEPLQGAERENRLVDNKLTVELLKLQVLMKVANSLDSENIPENISHKFTEEITRELNLQIPTTVSQDLETPDREKVGKRIRLEVERHITSLEADISRYTPAVIRFIKTNFDFINATLTTLIGRGEALFDTGSQLLSSASRDDSAAGQAAHSGDLTLPVSLEEGSIGKLLSDINKHFESKENTFTEISRLKAEKNMANQRAVVAAGDQKKGLNEF